MKIKFKSFLTPLIMAGILVINTSFIYPEYWDYIPIFMKRADLEKSVSYLSEGRDLENPGKIYYRSPYIFINERYKGVHVINNSDPYKPVKEGFIVAPGCIDMAVKGNVMYLDNSVDLVAFDLNAKQITKRIKNVFPEPPSPENRLFYDFGVSRDPELILVAWKKKPDAR
jgi:glutaredoxin